MKYYKIIPTIIPSLGLIFVLLVFSACSNEKGMEEEATDESGILISKTQFANEDMKLVKVEEQVFQDIIKTNGLIQLKPDALASIYSAITGKIKHISVQVNSPIKRGQVLCEIESNEFIQIQREYLASKARLKSVSANYQRTKDLFEKNISSEKEYIKIQSEYEILTANHQALKAQLQILQVNMKSLDKGEMSTYLSIYSPISGFISEISVNLGQFVGTDNELMTIIDGNGAQLQFPVYTQNLSHIDEGQQIQYYSNEFPHQKYVGEILSIGKSMLSNRQASLCIAKMKAEDKNSFVPGVKVQVEVLANKVEAIAVPNIAIIKSDSKFYVLKKIEEDEQQFKFEKVRVELGRSSATHTELLTPVVGEVLANGSYYFLGEE